MKQVSVIISTYTADVSGICSALYELGGMVVIHDPSGCNSTYNTHDEPRWYEQDSLVFISGLSEIDAIMGNDEKFIGDIVRAAKDLSPRFIALVRSPIPMMIGTDFDAIREIIERETGIPTFYFPTNGMHSYVQGVGMALAAVAEHMVETALPSRGRILPTSPAATHRPTPSGCPCPIPMGPARTSGFPPWRGLWYIPSPPPQCSPGLRASI